MLDLVWFGFSLLGYFRIFTWDAGDPSHWSLCFESDLELDLGSPHLSCLLFWSDSACQCLAVNRNITLQQISLLLVLVRAKHWDCHRICYLHGRSVRTLLGKLTSQRHKAVFTWHSGAQSQYQDEAKCFSLLCYICSIFSWCIWFHARLFKRVF